MTTELDINKFYVAFFSEGIDCYEQYSVSMSLDNAKKFLESQRERVPQRDWAILAVLDI